MLTLKKVRKEYDVAGLKVEALKGISISFRKNEFVSILGPSGCGKTTLLNIIGGLDKYTSGDLIINGKSTKEFTDRDWDVYRNHRIGFVFQSYNLIPHQTILGNVELALTIAGVSKEERTKRAMEALDNVGLKGLYNKKPNQLSGGQCQRVAIARALVNDPEIILADEPTGALDTKTSVQIMELLKKISSDKLIIMVTHNPELAYKYSTRIVKLLDGELQEDSEPFEEKTTDSGYVEKEKAKMKLSSTFYLSLKNLLSKRKRTILTCIAGSIGIIGISMVLAVSGGVKGYIANMQDDMLSGNPISIQESGFDYSKMMSDMSHKEKANVIKQANSVGVDFALETVLKRFDDYSSMIINNNITNEYVKYVENMPKEAYACISYDYGIDIENEIYTDFKPLNSTKDLYSLTYIKDNYANVLGKVPSIGEQYSQMVTSLVNSFNVAPDNKDYILSQYNVLYGDIAQEENEIMLVVDKDSMLADLYLALTGYYSQEQYIDYAIELKNNIDNFDMNDYIKNHDAEFSTYFSYKDLVENHSFYWYPNNSIYKELSGVPGEAFSYNYLRSQIEEEALKNGIELKIAGILEPKKNIKYGSLTNGFYYTKELANKIIRTNSSSEIAKYISKNYGTSMSYPSISKDEAGNPIILNTGINYTYQYSYINPDWDSKGNDDSNKFLATTSISHIGEKSEMGMLSSFFGYDMPDSYKITLRSLGAVETPSSIYIYPLNFDKKGMVTSYLDKWNDTKVTEVNGMVLSENRQEIKYTDNVGLIIDMINSMINIITIALICFTSLSLVVSCVMIAIITYVSVVERIKEIGIIRALGGRKKDVSRLFNAETFIIGLTSGVFAIAFTYIVSIIINIIVNSLTGVYPICSLPVSQALIMILISVLLTAISGVMPAISAAKKDPVVALRTE